MHRIALTLLAASCALPALAQDDVLALGREASAQFFDADYAALWARMTPDMQDALGSEDALARFGDQTAAELGIETEIVDETETVQGDLSLYSRTGTWSDAPGPVLVQFAFTADADIASFLVQHQPKAAESAYLDYTTKGALALPFAGDWFVFWGGREIADNYHAADPAQRFALDFVVHEDGQSYAGDPAVLENYHCWGREILAPADGQVIATVSDLPDQLIGQTDADNPAGNHVILALAESEFAFLAHMQQDSITVQNGDEVEKGDVLGLCGNSGNTSEPHLHFHLQTTPDLRDGEGLPAQFTAYSADGEAMTRGEPIRGQTVSPQP